MVAEVSVSRAYRALDLLYRTHGPRRQGRLPYWRPVPPPVVLGEVHEPRWSWRMSECPLGAGEVLTVLDQTAAYLAAIASVEVPHGPLTHQPRVRWRRPGSVGFWLIDWHDWHDPRLMSPLGSARRGGMVWVASPTLDLLDQLSTDGVWPEVRVHDAWLSDAPVRLRAWSRTICRDREAAIDAGDGELVAAIKLGYSQAVTVMQTRDAAHIYRPDWSVLIRAQFAASAWRRAWRAVLGGYRIVGASHVDELVMPRDDARTLYRRRGETPAPPIVLDLSGRTVGTYKVKIPAIPFGEWQVNRAIHRP